MTPKEIFMAGWRKGYSDGGDHDCRMFTPTAERAWDDFKFDQARAKKRTAPVGEETKG